MGRSPCCDSDANVKKGPWTAEEDKKLVEYIEKHGSGNWRQLPKLAGLNRCGKSCRLRWANYLRPDIKRGSFSDEDDRLIIYLHSVLGNKWSAIAARIPGRTDNEIKNYWNTHIRKKLLKMGIDPVTHMPRTDLNLLANLPLLVAANANYNSLATNPLINNALQLPKLQLLQTLFQAMANNIDSSPNLLGQSNLIGSLGHHDPNPILSGSKNLGLQNQFNNLQTVLHEKVNYASCNSSKFAVEGSTTSLTVNSTPSLISVTSLENFIGVEKLQDMVNSSSSSATPTAFEPWRELTIDDLDSNLGWKDILQQMSWPNPL